MQVIMVIVLLVTVGIVIVLFSAIIERRNCGEKPTAWTSVDDSMFVSPRRQLEFQVMSGLSPGRYEVQIKASGGSWETIYRALDAPNGMIRCGLPLPFDSVRVLRLPE